MRRAIIPFALFLLVLTQSVHAEVTMDDVRQEVERQLQSLPKPTQSASIFNPAMGLVLDGVASRTTINRSSFDFRSAELNFQSAVDPFLNLYAVLNGNGDGVQVEEAFVMTTSLPQATLRFGRMFANFGRLPHWHDHELPFVNRTPSLERFVGGESKADGLEVMHLFHTPFFLQGTVGAYNKIGDENDRLSSNSGDGHNSGRPSNAFTYLARLFSYVPIGDNFGIDVGASEAFTPRQYFVNGNEVDHPQNRTLTGADVTFRFEPLANNVYRRLIWGTEVFRNSETREIAGVNSLGNPVVSPQRRAAWGGYSYVDWRFSHWFSAGPFADISEDLDAPSIKTKTVGGVLNFYVSEFDRLRLQVSREHSQIQRDDNQVFVQWFATIGSHVHVFKDR